MTTKEKKKRILPLTVFMLSVTLLLGIFCANAYAEGYLDEDFFENYIGTTSGSGKCGDNLTWRYNYGLHGQTVGNTYGSLTISGTGDMYDYADYNEAPWSKYADSIHVLIIADGVTSIGDYAFNDCYYLAYGKHYCKGAVKIPDSVTSIGDYAFFDCAITDITLSQNLKSIGEYAFCYCNMSSVTIPEGCTYIGRSAFDNCGNLANISLPSHRIDIDPYAFYDTAYYETGSNWEDGALYIGNHLLDINSSLSNDFVIKEGTLEIPAELFSYNNSKYVTSITIPDSVEYIGCEAFAGAEDLKTVSISGNNLIIDDYAFADCRALESVTMEGVKSIGYRAFYRNESLKSIVIHDSVEYIGDYAFSWCEALESVVLPKNLQAIGNGTFLQCNIKSITIPDSVESIGEYAFVSCRALESVTLPKNLKSIGAQAFAYCSSIRGIDMPNSVTSIGESVFTSCTSLKSLTLSDNITQIPSNAFYECKRLTDIILPKNLTSIGDRAFAYTSLTSVNVPENVTTIGDMAFTDCEKLESITLPDSINTLGYDVFWNTEYYNTSDNWVNGVLYIGSSLIEGKSTLSGNCNIKNGTKVIAEEAFSYCTALTSITLPESIVSVGDSAFYGCSALTNATYIGSSDDWKLVNVGGRNDLLLSAMGFGNSSDSSNDNTGNSTTKELCNISVNTVYDSENKAMNAISLDNEIEASDVKVFFAEYDDGKLLSVQSKEYNNREVYFYNNEPTADSVRVFAWNSSLTPVAMAYDF